MYKMLKISAETYPDAKVHTIAAVNIRLFWVRICDVQSRVGFENIYDLLRKEIWSVYEIDNCIKSKQGNTKAMKKKCIIILVLILDIPSVILFWK